MAIGISETFVKAVEVWTPPADGQTLGISAAAYGDATVFAEASRNLRFRKGEGLPGQAWQLRRPLVLTDFEGAVFQRKQAADADGLSGGMGIPLFEGNRLCAVVLLLCGKREDAAGALEVWRRDADGRLRLDSGLYGSLKNLRYVSQRIHFADGEGLPGLVRAHRRPVMMDDLGRCSAFVRAHTARAEAVQTGLGLPVVVDGETRHVVLLLSAVDTPIARAFEIWRPDGDRLRLEAGAYGSYDAFGRTRVSLSLRAGDDVAGKVLQVRAPVICDLPAGERIDRLGPAVGIPIFDDAALCSVVVLIL